MVKTRFFNLMKLKTQIMVILLIGITLFVFFYQNKKSVHNNTEVNNMLASITEWDTSKVTIYTDSNGVQVPIPNGYVVSGVSGENVVKTGLVIYEGTASVTSAPTSGSSVLSSAQATRNQWVWVPVPDVSRIYSETNGVKTSKAYDITQTGRTATSTAEPGVLTSYDNEYYFSRNSLQGLARNELIQDMQIKFEDTIESIKKYGGFYIGRYETGNLTQKVPVVQKMKTTISNQMWYIMIDRFKYLGANNNVGTGLIWGNLWDETLQWLVDSGCKTYAQIADSKSWGNYTSSSFSYITTSGSTSTKSSGSGRVIPSGSAEYTKANNIYDMAGNVLDWSMDSNGVTIRFYRGGDYNSTGTYAAADDRFSTCMPTHSGSNLGARAYLYIK